MAAKRKSLMKNHIIIISNIIMHIRPISHQDRNFTGEIFQLVLIFFNLSTTFLSNAF